MEGQAQALVVSKLVAVAADSNWLALNVALLATLTIFESQKGFNA